MNLYLRKNLFDMETKAFFQYHIDDIKQYDGVEYVSCRDAILLHMQLADSIVASELHDPCRVDAFMAVICTRGEISFATNMAEHKLTKNMMFVSPASIFEFHESHDCELYVLAFDSNFIDERRIDMHMLVPIVTSFDNGLGIPIRAAHIDRMKRGFDDFYKEFANRQESPYTNLIVSHVFCSLIYRLCETISANQVEPADSSLGVKDRSVEYFKRMMQLMAENFRTERSVEFYADKMNLTPKHLSRVIRNFTGKSVHQWIDRIVVLEIKNLLRYSDMSIQQISYELNFPNPSFMGQYFKRVTGKTPGQFKRER